MSSIRILLVDHHRVAREGTRQLLERAPDLTVVGEAADGAEAVRLAGDLEPDVVIMEVCLPGLNGILATKAIKVQHPKMHVLALSAYEDYHYALSLLDAGASGYLLKTITGAELSQSVRAVHRGEQALDPCLSQKVVHRLTRRGLSQHEHER